MNKNMNKITKEIKDEIEIEDIGIRCFECKKEIEGKPWIILSCDNSDFHIYGCSYHCSKDLGQYMGGSYWDKVVNKEDFLKDPIPYQFEKKLKKTDICFNDYEIEKLKKEIEEEEQRIQRFENYVEFSSDDDYDEY